MLSPPALPETASSDATTIPYTVFSSDVSQYAVCAASHHLTTASHLVTGKSKELFRTTSNTKAKGGAHPRPSVSPAEYTQQQQQLCRNTSTATPPASAVHSRSSTSRTHLGAEKYAQCQAGTNGPLKVVNTTPRPESLEAFHQHNQENSGKIKKVTGFPLENESRTVSFAEERNGAADGAHSARSSQNVHDNSRWNVLRSALRKGIGRDSKRSSQDSSFLFEDDTPRRASSSTGVSEDATSAPGVEMPAKQQFFERYKKMAETTASSPGVMARSVSNNAISPAEQLRQPKVEPRHHRNVSSFDAKVRAGMLEALLEEEPFFMESPIDSRFDDAYAVNGESTSFWSGHQGDKITHTTSATAPVDSKALNRGSRLITSDLRRGSRLYGNPSISSLDSMQAEKVRMGETNLLTPSTSIDKLAEITRGSRRDAEHRQESTSWDDELDPVEGLDDKPFTGKPAKSLSIQMISPDLGKTTSRQSSHFRRESSVLSSLAPSDSISTPGATDRFHFDHYPAPTAIHAKPKPGTKTCQKCAQSLKGKRFIERDGMLLCEPDWKEMFLPKVSRNSL